MLETVPAKLLDAYVQDENVLVIDLRSSEEYQSGHMRGAVNAPMGQFADGWPERERTIVLSRDRGAIEYGCREKAFRTGIWVKSVVGGFHAYRGTQIVTGQE